MRGKLENIIEKENFLRFYKGGVLDGYCQMGSV